MELRVQRREVSEHPAPQGVQDVLADEALHHQEPVPRDGLGQRGAQHQGDHGDQRGEVVVGADRRDAGVDADLDEVGDREPGGVLDDHDEQEQLQRPGVRRQQLAQEAAGASAEPAGGQPLGCLVGVDRGLAPPGRGVGRAAHADTSSATDPASAASSSR